MFTFNLYTIISSSTGIREAITWVRHTNFARQPKPNFANAREAPLDVETNFIGALTGVGQTFVNVFTITRSVSGEAKPTCAWLTTDSCKKCSAYFRYIYLHSKSSTKYRIFVPFIWYKVIYIIAGFLSLIIARVNTNNNAGVKQHNTTTTEVYLTHT